MNNSAAPDRSRAPRDSIIQQSYWTVIFMFMFMA